MSLGVRIESTSFAILPGHEAQVLRHIQAWSKAKLELPSVVKAIARAKTPAEAFRAFGFTVDVDARGRIHDIELEGNFDSWFHDLGELWVRISPHMEPGATVTMETDDEGEDGPDVYELGGDDKSEGDGDDEEDDDEPEREL